VTSHVNDAYLTTLSGDWESYYASKRSSSTRKTDRKKRKRLAENGDIQFITASDDGDIERTVDALIEQKAKAYAKLGVADMFNRPGYRDFFLNLARDPHGRRLAHVSHFDVGAVTAAANYGLIFGGRYYYILAGYDDGELARHGPGSFQLHDLLRYAIERNLRQFDFTIGDEPYKREWSDTETRLFDHVAPVTWRGWLAAGPIIALRLVKRRIKRNPTAWSLVRKLRASLGSLRR
jgi:CelD/BcsL family acetyltransferase involved in cellulose biosynthesis